MKQPTPRQKSGVPASNALPSKLPWHDRPRWKSLKAVVDLFGILGGVVGVAFVAFQLWDAQQTRRVERSAALVARFNDTRMSEAADMLRRATLQMNEQLARVPDTGKTVGFDSTAARLVAEGLTSSADDKTRANQAALVAFARFFDEAALCVRSGLCDRRVVCLYLTASAGEVAQAFGPGLDAFNAHSGGMPVGAGLVIVAGYTCDAP